MFSALAENMPFFRKHLSIYIALAPVVRLDHCTSGILRKMCDNDSVEDLMVRMNIQEIFPASSNRKSAALF